VAQVIFKLALLFVLLPALSQTDMQGIQIRPLTGAVNLALNIAALAGSGRDGAQGREGERSGEEETESSVELSVGLSLSFSFSLSLSSLPELEYGGKSKSRNYMEQ
jgi:hypothetical protein